MRIEAKYYLSLPFAIHQGYRTLLIEYEGVTYINFKNNITVKFKINRLRYGILYKKYKLYMFNGSIKRGVYND